MKVSIQEALSKIKSEHQERKQAKLDKIAKNPKLKPAKIGTNTIALQIVLHKHAGSKSKKSIGYIDYTYPPIKLDESVVVLSEHPELASGKFKRNIRKYKWLMMSANDMKDWSKYAKQIATSKLDVSQKDGSMSVDPIAEAKEVIAGGRQRIRVYNYKTIQIAVGNTEMKQDEIVANVHHALETIVKTMVKPYSQIVEKIYLTATQGKAVLTHYEA